jgi:hypothetical protein
MQGAIAEARLAGNGPVLAKRRNNADGRFPARPQGATQMSQSGVAVLEKGLLFLLVTGALVTYPDFYLATAGQVGEVSVVELHRAARTTVISNISILDSK